MENLENWLAGVTDAVQRVFGFMGLDPPAIAKTTRIPTGLSGGYVSLDAQSRSYLVGLIADDGAQQILARALTGTEPDGCDLAPPDVHDALGEIVNMLAGLTKKFLHEAEPGLRTGLPIIVSGSILNVGRDAFIAVEAKMARGVATVLVIERSLSVEAAQWRRLERELAEREARLRAIMETAVVAIFTADAGGSIQSFNPAAQRMFGYTEPEIKGQRVDRILPRHARLDALAEARPETDQDEVGRRKSGELFPVDLSVSLFHADGQRWFAGIVRDISARRQAEANAKKLEVELRHAQKLESVGRLAAGIAHEINTPIQYVGDNCQFVKDAVPTISQLLETYRTICRSVASGAMSASAAIEELRAADERADLEYLSANLPKAAEASLDGLHRVAMIVRAMKEFAYPDRRDKSPADLNRAVMTTLTVARTAYRDVAEVETQLGDLPAVKCHVGAINQALLNVVVNAAHAIAAVRKRTARKGLITVRTSHDGCHATIAVSDTGCGIPDDIRDKVFDPFFTTKDVGEGTGQGLTVARNIVVDRHGGSITFESRVGAGTTFFIRLPLAGSAPLPRDVVSPPDAKVGSR